ncbi:hypothetical protein RRG08_007216 [Elysia crispata]|uniref:Uncharacterized protein n=1 Tax=Elysia crispata TaxID=231223 RepID=A0AAE1D9U4_9GAST|nr:hypothetical protein RRG08_007216 [Elysia crispata]
MPISSYRKNSTVAKRRRRDLRGMGIVLKFQPLFEGFKEGFASFVFKYKYSTPLRGVNRRVSQKFHSIEDFIEDSSGANVTKNEINFLPRLIVSKKLNRGVTTPLLLRRGSLLGAVNAQGDGISLGTLVDNLLQLDLSAGDAKGASPSKPRRPRGNHQPWHCHELTAPKPLGGATTDLPRGNPKSPPSNKETKRLRNQFAWASALAGETFAKDLLVGGNRWWRSTFIWAF